MDRRIALTMGDPAGIAGEIARAAWARLGADIPLLGIGDPGWFAEAGLPARPVGAAVEPVPAGAFPVMPVPLARPAVPGRPDPANAPAVVEAIALAARLALSGAVAAVCTNPISKKVLRDGAGFGFPGHTEFLAALAGVARPVMMLAGPGLRVVPVTIHEPLASVPSLLTPALLEETLRITAAALARDFGIARPRIAVAGLNPHAGEGGLMGREEAEVIAPVLARLAVEGMAVTGPHPADTMFHARARAGYDVAVCMYHDQALIPIKTLHFDEGVNVTLGLPFVRTSPDHGTAFDIAGQGRADPSSLIAALRLAASLGQRRG